MVKFEAPKRLTKRFRSRTGSPVSELEPTLRGGDVGKIVRGGEVGKTVRGGDVGKVVRGGEVGKAVRGGDLIVM